MYACDGHSPFGAPAASPVGKHSPSASNAASLQVIDMTASML
jgi:hypothetical protein